METSYSYKLKSHPDKLLIDHLQEVTNYAVFLIERHALFSQRPDMKPVIRELVYLMGNYHDITKAIRYFQHYLLSPTHEVVGPKSHALLSALFTKQIASEYLATTNLPEFEQQLLAHFTFTVVKRHHGRLLDFETELYALGNDDNKKNKELQAQIKVFDEVETKQIIRHFAERLGLQYSLDDFKAYIESGAYEDNMIMFYEGEMQEEDGGWQQLPEGVQLEYFYIHQLMFGSLLLADKTDVILDQERNKQREELADTLIEDFRKKKGFDKPSSDINQLKNQAYSQTLEYLPTVFKPEQHLYSITLPTGLGKTITSFAAALELKKLLGQQHRLIVTIPFTSIIDQNFEVYREILNNDSSRVLLKHHHLAEPKYKENDDTQEDQQKELDANKSQFLIETWQSEVVVTTFVQLLNSLYSNDKSRVMKLPNLTNAIIILDEVQTIPYCHWELVNRTFRTIGQLFNCYFILMSATQPLIFLPEREIKELVPDYKQYFRHFNRTRLINRFAQTITMAGFVADIAQYLKDNPKKDVLVILNTKDFTRQCFEQLRELVNVSDNDLYYLTTLITPFERKQIIGKIKEESDKRKIVISTQLIEAGVDISVDAVFRALAPLDAIIQAAGRANRYNEKAAQGEVYLYEIEEMIEASTFVYGATLIQKTRNVLKNIDQIEEQDYLRLIETYFVEVHKQSEIVEQPYLEAMKKLDFEKVGQFSLIEERENVSVFVMLNDSARKAWNDYKKIYNDDSLKKYEQKRAFAQIKAVFYDYVISVGTKHAPGGKEKELHFYVLEPDKDKEFYTYNAHDWSLNTGYQTIEKKTEPQSSVQNF